MKRNKVRVFQVETSRETDGRFIGDVLNVPGAMSYGANAPDAAARAVKLAIENELFMRRKSSKQKK